MTINGYIEGALLITKSTQIGKQMSCSITHCADAALVGCESFCGLENMFFKGEIRKAAKVKRSGRIREGGGRPKTTGRLRPW